MPGLIYVWHASSSWDFLFSFFFLRHAMWRDSFMYAVTYFAHLDATHVHWSLRQKISASWIISPFCSPMKAAPTRYASRSILLLLCVCFGIHLKSQSLEESRHFAHTRRLHWCGITPRSFWILSEVCFDTSLGPFYICAARIIHTCDMTNSWLWHDPFTWCGMAHSYVWHDSFICATWLIHKCDMTHSYVRLVQHHFLTCGTWLIHIYDMTHLHVWCCSFTCVTCHVTR